MKSPSGRPTFAVPALLAIACLLVLPPAARAQDDATGPAGGLTPYDPAAGAADTGAQDDLEKLLSNLSPEEVEQLIRTAVQSRLKVERQQVAEEIKEDLLSDPDDIDAAVKVLEDNPKNTQTDNIDRILRALAQVDLRIGQAWKLLGEKKYEEAAKAVEKDLNVQEATYRSAARYTLYARALDGQGKGYDAAEAYQKVLVLMADRISFAAAAAMESARLYEAMDRFTYAAEMYTYAVSNYGLTLDEPALKLIEQKVKEYEAFGKDPLGWAEKTMGEVRRRLEKLDSGQETQAKEEKIVAVITDLIKTAEEKQRNSQNSSQQRQRQQQGTCKKCGQQGCQGECSGSASASGKSQSPPKGTQQPSNPAQVSAVVPGAVARPTKRSEVRQTSEVGDWANLPPRERQKLEQLRRKVMSERYRDIISKYRTRISERGAGE
ncbi:MAG TPA: hypothetical protein VM695_13570 [Phycisphaerae bacterium]|nr:hypothetical protein [Phycisphaerae bacterium]